MKKVDRRPRWESIKDPDAKFEEFAKWRTEQIVQTATWKMGLRDAIALAYMRGCLDGWASAEHTLGQKITDAGPAMVESL